MTQSNSSVTVVIIEKSYCLIALDCSFETATTLIALIYDDPENWAEATSLWPRYRTPPVHEFISSIPFEDVDFIQSIEHLATAESSVAIDFREKRIFNGGSFTPVGRDAVLAMVVYESGVQRYPLSIHLPPWWELHEGANHRALQQHRQAPIDKPSVDREVLYGDAFLADIATRVIETVDSEPWRCCEADKNENARYAFTVAVHRDWLMTPRTDLGGRMPRELLHGAREWSGRVTRGQRLRFEDGGPMIAAPCDWAGFDTAPMGSEEMYLYFDLCREVIDASWFFLTKMRDPSDELAEISSRDSLTATNTNAASASELIEYLRDVRDSWLDSPFEGGSPPRFIIECDRRRVPRGAGVAIEGIDAVQSTPHIVDCDCPICEMMVDGFFGVGFTGIDGHHLELDDEFAFSMHQTRERWEEQQREYAEFSAKMDLERQRHKSSNDTEDPFDSAWSGHVNNQPIPGDKGGFLKMAFMVAEIIGALEASDAPHEDIKLLNESFADFRRSDEDERVQSAARLKSQLEVIADRYPSLVSKSADLQSRIDEAVRGDAMGASDFDVPF